MKIFYEDILLTYNKIIFGENKSDKLKRPIDFYRYILQIYFPKLFLKEIYTYEHDDTIPDEKLNNWNKKYKKIDHFYDFFYEKDKTKK